MKSLTGLYVVLAGAAAFALILSLFVHFTVTDSPWRILGFLLALAAFVGGIVLGRRTPGKL